MAMVSPPARIDDEGRQPASPRTAASFGEELVHLCGRHSVVKFSERAFAGNFSSRPQESTPRGACKGTPDGDAAHTEFAPPPLTPPRKGEGN